VKTLFFGTSAFAVPSLRVTASHSQLAGVVTQPDRPAGRGHKPRPSPVKTCALELGQRVYEPSKLRELAASLAGEPFDLFVLVSYGRILPKELLALPRLGALNVHPSLLPKYRGATPIQTALRNGERETGVTIMLMDAGLDTGDVVSSRPVPVAQNETYGELHDRLASIGADLLGRALDLAAQGKPLPRVPQQGEATLTKPIVKDDLVIDWAWPPQRIVDHVRAYAPQPAARATVDGQTLKILRAHVRDDGHVEIDELIAPNRGRMSWAQYVQRR